MPVLRRIPSRCGGREPLYLTAFHPTNHPTVQPNRRALALSWRRDCQGCGGLTESIAGEWGDAPQVHHPCRVHLAESDCEARVVRTRVGIDDAPSTVLGRLWANRHEECRGGAPTVVVDITDRQRLQDRLCGLKTIGYRVENAAACRIYKSSSCGKVTIVNVTQIRRTDAGRVPTRTVGRWAARQLARGSRCASGKC